MSGSIKFGHTFVFAMVMLLSMTNSHAVEQHLGEHLAVPPDATVERPQGAQIIPEQFLRRWDPVTIFFDSRVGPAEPAPEDHPEKYVSMMPAHPGVYTWLNSTTLQFRPVEPWPPLTEFSWKVEGDTQQLTTLMAPPTSTLPSDNALDLQAVETITLTFPEPLDTATLAEMVKIELMPLPGVGGDQSRWLDQQDFEIKVMERQQRSDQAGYILLLNEAIPSATHVVVHLRLSLEDDIEQSFKRISFSTAEAFRVTRFGCANNLYPTAPGGIHYTPEQSIQCNANNREIEVQFSAPPQNGGPIAARNLVRFTPAVEGLEFSSYGNQLSIKGNFKSDTLYRVSLQDAPLLDEYQRPLEFSGSSELYLHFPAKHSFISWESSQGIVERFGPQMVPLKGRGFDRLDLRIYPIDPIDRSFWPFPAQPVVVNEANQPAGPGELPKPFSTATRNIYSHELTTQIAALGSPVISELVSLPLSRDGGAANFGLDLSDYFTRIKGKKNPGSYLVGLRQLDGSNQRSWIRVQVTDLSLTVIEEVDAARFVVTSLSSGKPVANAQISVEGSNHKGEWVVIESGHTDGEGVFTWLATDWGKRYYSKKTIRRIVVKKGDDSLVLDPANAPDQYSDNYWGRSYQPWLAWVGESTANREDKPETLCHIFTERPIYKPEEAVHIKGYIRDRHKNRISLANKRGQILVYGPGGREWRYPLILSRLEGFYYKFNEEKLPTGSYRVVVELERHGRCGEVVFKKEAYRVPRFEVELSSPDIVSLDDKFNVQLSSRYYAGGQVAGQPVRWRVTQFPYTWSPKAIEGFYFSSDGRFSGRQNFRASPVIQREGETDENGSAQIELDPTVEPTAQPRSYVVEATVVGADDQTVTNTRRIVALPPLVLGLKAPRYLKQADSVTPEVIALGHDGELIAGQPINLKLSKRQWHSHLQATDFSSANAKYVTEVVDEVISETTLQSGEQAIKQKLQLQGAGVYIIEIESRDRLGRVQVVSIDFYAGGDEPVTWSRPPSKVFTVTPDAKNYKPGDKATLVLESPFQTARVLAIIEGPDGNRYEWLNVRNGAASFEVPIEKHYTPRVPVHFVLMRGRMSSNLTASSLDLGKPTTLAATTWLQVEPVAHRVEVALDHAKKAQPGDVLDVTIHLTDKEGKPLAGEVTLWLVDQAVLALGKEQRLDPLSDFITSRSSRMVLRDTRNLAFGHLPFAEQPGGGFADMLEKSMLGQAVADKVTVRKNFSSVPYFNPTIPVGKRGTVKVSVQLPDNLTVFKLRAKAVSNEDRFGYAKSEVAVRLPVIVQPSLPRFVRPGDSFVATAIGRIVDGEGGAGRAEAIVEGLELEAGNQQHFEWQKNVPQRIDFKMQVPSPGYNEKGQTRYDEVSFTGVVERSADGARDAFQVKLPLRPDRKPVIERVLSEVAPLASLTLPAVEEEVRPGTLKRSLLISDQPALISMAAGLNYLMEYPHGCTEQRLSRARAYVAMDRFRDLLTASRDHQDIVHTVEQTLQWFEGVVDSNGLAGYWPGSKGYVSLTSWVVQFMVEARAAGYQINENLLDKMTTALRKSLRSDYKYFISGESYTERTMALWALAATGEIDGAYAAELVRKANYLSLESLAQVTRVLHESQAQSEAMLDDLDKRLWDGLVFRLYQGNEVYGGLQGSASSRNRLVLPSETRTVAEILRTTQATSSDDPRTQKLVDALVMLGEGNGWGSTNATVSALLALNDYIDPANPSGAAGPLQKLNISLDGEIQNHTLGESSRLLTLHGQKGDGIEVTRLASDNDRTLSVRTETRYLPVEDGSYVQPKAKGFVVNRELLKVVAEGEPMQRTALSQGGEMLSLQVGDVIEDHIEVVNAVDRTFVAVVVPIAAGMEPLNPRLATAPPEAKAEGTITLEPSYSAYMDDQVAFYYDSLPKGNYHFYFRTRATIQGVFIQPAAYAEMMYEEAVMGNSAGAKVSIERKVE